MAKQKFSPMALDDILKNALDDTENLQNELTCTTNDVEVYENDDIIPAPAVNPVINNLINSADSGKTCPCLSTSFWTWLVTLAFLDW